MNVVREVIATPNGLEALALVMPYILEVNEHVRPEALQALLEREIGPQTKDTIVTAGQQLIEQGMKQGIEQGIVRSLINIYEARFGAMPEEIRAVIEATHDEPTLLTWLTLAGTRGVDEVTAAIRASRPN
jgi:alcohol dehydrogenase class IV